MASDEQAPPGPESSPEGGAEKLTPEQQEELRRQLEDQIRKVRVQDVLLESVASILNLSARRITKEDERDLEQARIGIDAVRAVVDLLAPEPREQVRQALAELQMLYAREAGSGAAAPGGEGEGAQQEAPSAPQPETGAPKRGSGLWTPPGTS